MAITSRQIALLAIFEGILYKNVDLSQKHYFYVFYSLLLLHLHFCKSSSHFGSMFKLNAENGE